MKVLTKIFEWLTGLTLGQLAYLGLLVFFYSTAIAFYITLFTGAIQLYNLTNELMVLLTSGSSATGGVAVSKFFGLLNCMGVYAGFEAGKPALFSAIVFLFLRISTLLFMQAYGLILLHAGKLLLK